MNFNDFRVSTKKYFRRNSHVFQCKTHHVMRPCRRILSLLMVIHLAVSANSAMVLNNYAALAYFAGTQTLQVGMQPLKRIGYAVQPITD